MCAKSSLPVGSIEASEHRKWFDGWRIVTGVLTVPFLAGSVLRFVPAVQYREVVVTAIGLSFIGLSFLAVAGSFGAATLLPSGGGGRAAVTVIGLALGFILALLAAIVVLLFITYQSGDVDHEESWFTYDLGYTAACLMKPGDGAAPGARPAPFSMAGLEPGWGAL